MSVISYLASESFIKLLNNLIYPKSVSMEWCPARQHRSLRADTGADNINKIINTETSLLKHNT